MQFTLTHSGPQVHAKAATERGLYACAEHGTLWLFDGTHFIAVERPAKPLNFPIDVIPLQCSLNA